FGALIIEDEIAVGLNAAGGFDSVDRRPHLKVARQVMVDIKDADGVVTRCGRRNFESTAAERPTAAVDEKALSLAIVEIGGAKHVALPARDIAWLRIGRAAGLLLPQPVIAGDDQAEFTIGLAPAIRIVAGIAGAGRIGAIASCQRV